jgi:hypothetical protein
LYFAQVVGHERGGLITLRWLRDVHRHYHLWLTPGRDVGAGKPADEDDEAAGDD